MFSAKAQNSSERKDFLTACLLWTHLYLESSWRNWKFLVFKKASPYSLFRWKNCEKHWQGEHFLEKYGHLVTEVCFRNRTFFSSIIGKILMGFKGIWNIFPVNGKCLPVCRNPHLHEINNGMMISLLQRIHKMMSLDNKLL